MNSSSYQQSCASCWSYDLTVSVDIISFDSADSILLVQVEMIPDELICTMPLVDQVPAQQSSAFSFS